MSLVKNITVNVTVPSQSRLERLLDTNVTACLIRRHVFLALNSKRDNWGEMGGILFIHDPPKPFIQLSKCQHCLYQHRGESNVSEMSILGH